MSSLSTTFIRPRYTKNHKRLIDRCTDSRYQSSRDRLAFPNTSLSLEVLFPGVGVFNILIKPLVSPALFRRHPTEIGCV